MNDGFVIGWFVIVSCLIVVGCTLKSLETRVSGVKEATNPKVLIASQNTKFKVAVVAEIRDTLVRNSCYIKTIDVNKLRNESTDQYSVIIIINKSMAGRPDPRVESFIIDVQERNKIVLLTTGLMDSWKPESPEIDAMTSASTLSESSQIAQVIVGKVLGIIQVQRKL